MKLRRLGFMLSVIIMSCHFTPALAEINRGSQGNPSTPEASYLQYISQMHAAQTTDQLPVFSHSSPLNKAKMADSRVEEKELLAALKEMTPHTLKAEGKIEFGDRVYLFYAGDPDKADSLKEYFPVTAEMVKEEGKWKLRRQQSWHVKEGSPESEVIPQGQARLKRFQDLLTALTKPIPAQPVQGDVRGVKFKPTIAYFYPREGYFKLSFVEGEKQFSIYIREGCDLNEVQGRHFIITPLEGAEADLLPEEELFGPCCAKLEFGRVDKQGFLPGTISLAVRTPESANLCGVFMCTETADTLSPDDDEKGKKKNNNK